MDNLIIYIFFAIIGIILFFNVIKIFINIFTKSKAIKNKENPLQNEIREEIERNVKPHLTSLEGMYEKSNSDADSFAKFVFSTFKGKFSSLMQKDEKLVESEICHCCDEYENSECKESFCLEGAGISCPNS